MAFKFVDLFCGMGGFHRALASLGGRCVLACDIDEKCRDTYEANFGITPEEDIRDLKAENVPDHDILCGGFPCFVAGTRVLTHQGYKKIEDVNLDDTLLTHKGVFQKIVNTQMKLYSGKIYTIVTDASEVPIKCTEEHPFYTTSTSSSQKEWTPASELTTNHFLLFPVKDSEEVTYKHYKINDIHVSTPPPQIVYNFEVENDNSYCVENVIVHNCQSFSSAGHKHAMEDSRGTLFYEIARIVKLKQPKYLLLENVKHIMKIQDGIVFETILKTFEDLGYSMKTVVLSPDMFGVPQHRERVYFMGVLNGDVPDLLPIVKEKTVILGKPEDQYKVKPEVDQALSAWDEALPILKEWQSKVPVLIDEFRNTDDLSDYPVWKRRYVEKNKELYSQNPTFWDAWEAKHADVLSKRKVYRKLEWQVGSIADNDSIWNHFIQLRQSGIRVKKADTFPTLVAIVQTPIYGPEHRHLTPRECARLQSFPEDQILPEKNQVAYKQLGNSVNVNVVTHVASSLLQRTS